MNYAELNQTILEYTENNELKFVENIPKFIRFAEQRIYHEAKLPQFRNSRAWRLTPSMLVQSLPTDFMAANSLLVDDDMGHVTYLDLKEPEYATVAFGAEPGMPRVYALRQDKELIVAPVPDAPYQAVMSYFFYPESITTTTDGHSWLGDHYADVLLYGSLLEAYTFMKGEADIMTAYQAQYASSLRLLKSYVTGPLKNDTYSGVAV